MDQAAITRYITELGGIDVLIANDDAYFYYDPERTLPPDRRMPFATIMTSDAYDSASNLSRPGVFRMNIGVGKDTYRSLFGPLPQAPGAAGIVDTGHDFAALDQLLPHPV